MKKNKDIRVGDIVVLDKGAPCFSDSSCSDVIDWTTKKDLYVILEIARFTLMNNRVVIKTVSGWMMKDFSYAIDQSVEHYHE